jgi:hypothetical protein
MGARSLDDWGKVAALFASFAQLGATAIGGVWLYRRFVVEREHIPRIDIDLSITWIGRMGENDDGDHIAHLRAVVKNSGLVKHPVRWAKYSLRYLTASDALQMGSVVEAFPPRGPNEKFANDTGKQQLVFPRTVGDEVGNWSIKCQSMIERQTTRYYDVVVAVPAEAKYVLLTSVFTAADRTVATEEIVSRVGERKVPGNGSVTP